MTYDTEWPASPPQVGERPSRIEADRLAWCIRYLADEARRSGFDETAAALDAVKLPRGNEHFSEKRPYAGEISKRNRM
jgi:hypothetical protein